jgi:hypothetical protein
MLYNMNDKKIYLNKTDYNFVNQMRLNCIVAKFEVQGYNVKVITSETKYLLILTNKNIGA